MIWTIADYFSLSDSCPEQIKSNSTRFTYSVFQISVWLYIVIFFFVIVSVIYAMCKRCQKRRNRERIKNERDKIRLQKFPPPSLGETTDTDFTPPDLSETPLHEAKFLDGSDSPISVEFDAK